MRPHPLGLLRHRHVRRLHLARRAPLAHQVHRGHPVLRDPVRLGEPQPREPLVPPRQEPERQGLGRQP